LKRIQDAAKVAAERELRNKATGVEGEKRPEDNMPRVSDLALGDSTEFEVKKTKKSKKSKPEVKVDEAMDVDIIPGVAAPTNNVEEDLGVEKKEKKSKRSKLAVEAEVESIPAVMITTNDGDAMEEDTKSEKKSKKRKRDKDDEGGGGKENGEGETLSFQERSRAAKKARKAEKAAKRAAREGTSTGSVS
jgi:hypothetical protein